MPILRTMPSFRPLIPSQWLERVSWKMLCALVDVFVFKETAGFAAVALMK